MNARILAAALMLAGPAGAQGFAGLGQGGEGFALPAPGPDFAFPADHGAHPEYRIEWWYLTAYLDGEGGPYGIQWTLFRSALAPAAGGVPGPQVWMAHLGLTTPEAHLTGERLARGGVGQAGVEVAPFAAWLDEWRMEGTADTGDALDALRLTGRMEGASYDLELRATGPLVFHGEAGFSVKSEGGQASYYYSQPFYQVAGTLDLPGGAVEVTGQGWLDREWSSEPLEGDQEGWDWFSLHLEDGAKLMAFQLRGDAPFTYASWIEPDGRLTPYYGALTVEPLRTAQVEGREVPVDWRLTLPERGLDVTVEAVNDDSWQATLFPYWEGPVRARGSHAGVGYLEMTGYE
jgi:predicted secreted hydrolase